MIITAIQHRRRQLAIVLMLIQLRLSITCIWVCPMNNRRFEKGEFFVLYPDLRQYKDKYFNWFHTTTKKWWFKWDVKISRSPKKSKVSRSYKLFVICQKISNVNISNTLTMDEVHKKFNLTHWGSHTMRSILRWNMKIIENGQMVMKFLKVFNYHDMWP